MSPSTGWYEISLDLRAETPPGPAAPTFGPVPCADDTPGLEAQDFPPLGNGTGGNAAVRPDPYVLQYFRAGLAAIVQPQPVGTAFGDYNSWQFPVFGAGGPGTRDYCGANLGNSLRIVTVSGGVLSTDAFGSHSTSFTWRLVYWNGANEITEQSGSIATDGSMIDVTVPQDAHCYHILILENFTSGGPGRFNFDGAHWEPDIGIIP